MSKKVIEGELLNKKDKKPTNREEFGNFRTDISIGKMPGWRLLISLIPIIGLLFSVGWYYYCKQKNKLEIVFPIIGIVIGLFSTTTFLVLRFIFKSIF